MTSAPTTSEGAPVISLERTVQPDSIAIVWKPVKGASPPIIGYDLYVNGAKFGSPVREHYFVGYCFMQFYESWRDCIKLWSHLSEFY